MRAWARGLLAKLTVPISNGHPAKIENKARELNEALQYPSDQASHGEIHLGGCDLGCGKGY